MSNSNYTLFHKKKLVKVMPHPPSGYICEAYKTELGDILGAGFPSGLISGQSVAERERE
jgi:hypothetical protein